MGYLTDTMVEHEALKTENADLRAEILALVELREGLIQTAVCASAAAERALARLQRSEAVVAAAKNLVAHPNVLENIVVLIEACDKHAAGAPS